MSNDKVEACSAYKGVQILSRTALRLFFRDVSVVGKENFPRSGPVILIANHSNQFVDAMALLHACPRPVSFMIAEKSLHRPVIGPAAQGIRAVGVVRAQDEVATCSGKIVSIDCEAGIVIGEGTKFATEELTNGWNGRGWNANDRKGTLCKGDKLMKGEWADGDDAALMKYLVIEEVVSDTELRIKPIRRPPPEDGSGGGEAYATAQIAEGGTTFKAMPRLGMRGTLRECAKHVAGGGVFGIFPEGGSHDQASLLPLKNGVALISLMSTYQGDCGDVDASPPEAVKVVPCGITYFHGNRFRSSAMIEFGKPISVPAELAQLYAQEDRSAAPAMLEKIREALESVTLNVSVSELREVFSELADEEGLPGVNLKAAMSWSGVQELIAPATWTPKANRRPSVLSQAEVEVLFNDVKKEGMDYLEYVEFKTFCDKLGALAIKKAAELKVQCSPSIMTEHDGAVVQAILATARRVYTDGMDLSPAQYLALTRNFAQGYNKLKDLPEGKELMSEVTNYHLALVSRNVNDHDVRTSPASLIKTNGTVLGGVYYTGFFLFHFLRALILAPLCLPGILLWMPVARICASRAEKARIAAVRGSSVKIKGRDTVASKKVVEGFKMVPLFYFIYAVIACGISIALSHAYSKPGSLNAEKPWLFPVIVWLAFPWYAYFSIRLWDAMSRSIRKLYGASLIMCDRGDLSLPEQRQELRRNLIEFMKQHKDDLGVENMDLVLPELLEGDLTGGNSASPLTGASNIEMKEAEP